MNLTLGVDRILYWGLYNQSMHKGSKTYYNQFTNGKVKSYKSKKLQKVPQLTPFCGTTTRTRMWANAQRDGRPAEYRWRPLFNAAKFG